MSSSATSTFPGDSGFDLCRRLKADPILRIIPIVVCTGEADP